MNLLIVSSLVHPATKLWEIGRLKSLFDEESVEAVKRIIIHKASLADMDKESLGQVSIQDKPRE